MTDDKEEQEERKNCPYCEKPMVKDDFPEGGTMLWNCWDCGHAEVKEG